MDKKMLKAIPIKKYGLGIAALTNLQLTYFINAYVRNKILILDIYDISNKLKYRIFQTKTEFVTLEGNKWRKSMLINLNNYYPYPTYLASKDSEKVIQKYLGTEEGALDAIKSTQEGIRKAELENRHKAEIDLIDSYMKPVKMVPKDFEKWINDVALLKSRYIIYEYKASKTMKGKCTHCHADVMVTKPKHNAPGTCPSCKSEITYKAQGKANNIVDRCTTQLLQRHPLGVIVREFDVIKRYTKFGGSNLSYMEKNRSITGKENLYFAWDEFKSTNVLRWCKDRYWDIDDGVIYTKNLKRELSETEFKYSGLSEMTKSGRVFSATDYLRAYQKGPALEYLSKLKLYNLVMNILHFNRYTQRYIDLKGKSLFEVLKLNKENLNRAVEMNATSGEIELLQIAQKERVSIPDEYFKSIAKEHSYHYEDFIRMSKLSTIHQLLRYLRSKNVNFMDYRDYIDMAMKLNWDITDRFILFPRHFKQAHDQAMELVKVKETYHGNIIIKKMFQESKNQFGFEDEECLIRLPMTAREIIREGHTLHHCVSNYVNKVAKGETMILFIRKKENPFTPYYTLELNPIDYKVLQVRGERNKSADDNIKKLLDKYIGKLQRDLNHIAC